MVTCEILSVVIEGLLCLNRGVCLLGEVFLFRFTGSVAVVNYEKANLEKNLSEAL